MTAPPTTRRLLPAVEQFNVLGYRFAVVTRARMALPLLRRLYGAAEEARDAAATATFRLDARMSGRRRVWQVSLGDEILAERPSLARALRGLEYEVCVRVMDHRVDLVWLHGATMLTADGAAFITGSSSAGKTTLALGLAARGFRVGGDDVAQLDPETGGVVPLPRFPGLDARAKRLVRQAGLQAVVAAGRRGLITPADLGAGAPTPVPVRRLIHTERGTGRSPRLQPVSQAEMAVLLLNRVRAAATPTPALVAALSRLASGATCYRLISGRLPATLDAVAAVLGPPLVPADHGAAR